eukprot:TRINITY_DN36875_c0_g1_i1.p1 TRINITY_DN36875_c0_g1~~TRINITY_DN36875_c0_g1_i1.p1  ORF type:complete len:356 (-),score=78.57 TRINITY_DN36875_c0_g1_i1:54-1058(-)
MKPVAYRRGWVAEAPDGAHQEALAAREAERNGYSGSQAPNRAADWEREGDHWLLRLPAASASDVALDLGEEALQATFSTAAAAVPCSWRWPSGCRPEDISACTARFSRRRGELLVSVPAAPLADEASEENLSRAAPAREGWFASSPPEAEEIDRRVEQLKSMLPKQRPSTSTKVGKTKQVEMDAADAAAVLMLHSAASLGNISLAVRLLEAKADPNVPDELGATALEKACLAGSAELVRAMLTHSANVNGAGPGSPSTPLHRAAALGEHPQAYELLRLLLEHGANPKTKDSSGRTAAELARIAGLAALPPELEGSEAEESLRATRPTTVLGWGS